MHWGDPVSSRHIILLKDSEPQGPQISDRHPQVLFWTILRAVDACGKACGNPNIKLTCSW